MISTKNLGSAPATTGTTKREKVKNLRKTHEPLFVKEGVVNPKFIPRMCYKHEGELIIGFYEREVLGGKDIYTEFCSREYNPEDPDRKLWKWQYNPEYKTEYKLSDPHPGTQDRRYLIPIEELINVTETHAPKVVQVETTVEESTPVEESLIDIPSAGQDVPYSDMTLRDYAAIQLKKPVSHKAWLNELITKTNQ